MTCVVRDIVTYSPSRVASLTAVLDDADMYAGYKTLQGKLEFLKIQEECIKDEMK